MDGKIKEIEDLIRDLMNWAAVLADEYNLEDEDLNQLKNKLEAISQKVAKLPVK